VLAIAGAERLTAYTAADVCDESVPDGWVRLVLNEAVAQEQ
jgi:hypothetical protein